MTMELLEGKLLSAMMREWKTVPAPFAYRILQGCARALAHAHGRNIVHGDFKPGNVFITRDETVKVIDFGAAAAPRTQVSRIPAGTPAYASPEVLSGEAPELRDDIFSFACVAYELLTGEHPFDRRSSLQAREEGRLPPRAWNLSASQWLALLSALSWRREQRPNNIEALVIALTPEARAGAATGARNRSGARTRSRCAQRTARRPDAAATQLGILHLHRLRARRYVHRRSAADDRRATSSRPRRRSS